MWKNRLKELLYILENSNVNEIDVTFFGIRYRVVKEPSINNESLPATKNKLINDSKQTTDSDESIEKNIQKRERNE